MDWMPTVETVLIIAIVIITSITIFINIQTIRINRRIARLEKMGWKKDEKGKDE